MTVMRAVRRVTVEDGVDIPLTTVLLTRVNVVFPRLIVVSVNPHSVTYDIDIKYAQRTTGTIDNMQYQIISNLISDGTDITEEILTDGEVNIQSDIHRRDMTNGTIITNVLIVRI